MRTGKRSGFFALALVAIALSAIAPARADDAGVAKTASPVTAFWLVPKEEGKLELVVPGQKDPVITTVSAATIFAGICLDCSLPMEFKTGDTAKSCAVCGCAATNAACIVGKPVKSNTWQAM